MAKNEKPNPSELILFEQEVFKELGKYGHIGKKALEFVTTHNVRIKFSQQKHSGAKWTLLKDISLNLDNFSLTTNPADPGLLSIVLHEIRHLEQGLFTALSVYGELDAWQVGFAFYQEITGRTLRDPLRKLMDIQLGWSRPELVLASELMKEYSPGYRIDWLPLYPIQHEIIWLLTHQTPNELKNQTTDQ